MAHRQYGAARTGTGTTSLTTTDVCCYVWQNKVSQVIVIMLAVRSSLSQQQTVALSVALTILYIGTHSCIALTVRMAVV